MFGFIKNWFKKEEPKEEYYIDFIKLREQSMEEYYIDFRKLREKSMEDDLCYIMSNIKLIPGQTHIPATWIYHIEKCVEYGCIETALKHMRIFFHYIPGTNIDLSPLVEMIENSKEYKQMKLKEKLQRIKSDFE